MALQIRRGSNQERLGITLVSGEVVFVTDSELSTTIVNGSGSTFTASLNHGLTVNQKIMFQGTSVDVLVGGTIYYVKTTPTSTTFTISATLGGTAITLTAPQTNLTFAKTPCDASGNPIGYSVNPLWVGDGTTVGGRAAGVTDLDALNDVEIGQYGNVGQYGTALAQGQLLTYNATTSSWENAKSIKADIADHAIEFARKNAFITDTSTQFRTALFATKEFTDATGSDLKGHGGPTLVFRNLGNDGSSVTTHNVGVLANTNNLHDFIIRHSTDSFASNSLDLLKLNPAGSTLTSPLTVSGATIINGAQTVNGDQTVNGNVAINSTTPTAISAVSETVGAINPLTVRRTYNSSTIPGLIGTIINFETENALHVNQTTGTLGFTFTDTTSGSEDSRFTVGLLRNGSASTADLTLTDTGLSISGGTLKLNALNSVPGGDAYITVERGTTDAYIRWNETNDRWEFNDGTSTVLLPNQSLTTTSEPTFAGAFIGNIYLGLASNNNTISTDSGNLLLYAAPGQKVIVGNDLQVTSNIMKSSSGSTVFTLSGDSATVAGNLTVNGTLSASNLNLTINSDQVTEGSTNLYFTTARARSSLSGVSGEISYNSTTGAIGINSTLLYNIANKVTNGASATLADLTLTGNLTVNGTTTTINSRTLEVDDKNIVIGNGGDAKTNASAYVDVLTPSTTANLYISTSGLVVGQTFVKSANGDTPTGNIGSNARIISIDGPNVLTFQTDTANQTGNIYVTIAAGQTDATAAGGGITLNGTTDKTIIWNTDADGWEFNQPIKVTGNAVVSKGVYAKAAMDATFTDGIVLDYVTGNGRISTGSSDTLSFYNGGVAGTLLGQFSTAGNLTVTGDLRVNGNDIQSSGGSTAITLSGTDVVVAGNIKVTGNDIRSSTGSTALRLNDANVTILGDLAVNDGDITTISTTASLFNATATTVNIGAAATTVAIGASTGNFNINNPSVNIATSATNPVINFGSLSSQATAQITTSSTTQTSIMSTSKNVMKCIVSIRDTVTSALHTVEVLLLRNGSSAALITVYGELYTSIWPLATFDADVSGGNIRLLVTPASSNSTTFNVIGTNLS